MKGALTATAAAGAALAFAVPALGGAGPPGSIVNSHPPVRGPGHLTINGGAAANDIVVSWNGGRYEVRDAAGITAGANCEAASSIRARCFKWARDGFGVGLDAGDDRLVVEVAGRYGGIRAGTGDDAVWSSNVRNSIGGQAGADTLIGRGGNDSLRGELGRDRLFGGQGNDRLDANDDARDKAIACGPGRDIALIDPALDPEPVGCEVLVRRGHERGKP